MSKLDVATMSIGQGIAVTPLQMVRAFGAIANGGSMMKPHIVKSYSNIKGEVTSTTDPEVVGNQYQKKQLKRLRIFLKRSI